jgi:hypothetical protein
MRFRGKITVEKLFQVLVYLGKFIFNKKLTFLQKSVQIFG